jgi:isoquinoline 1-oxidoreductase alpha subunit
VLAVSAVQGKSIRTVEALASSGQLTKLQKAWVENQTPQCGYCQSGMVMAATALLEKNPNPTDADIDAAMTNICRCGTYQEVRRAIRSVSQA